MGLVGRLMDDEGETTTKQATIDPRIAGYLFGDPKNGNPGLLDSATRIFQDQMLNGGINPMQRAGMEMQRQTLMHPSYTQGAQAAQSLGLGLMGGGVASNPFNTGQMGLLSGTSPQGLMAAGQGLLGSGGQPQQAPAPQGLLSQAIRPAPQAAYQPMAYEQNEAMQAASSPIARGTDYLTPPKVAEKAKTGTAELAANDPWAYLHDGSADGGVMYRNAKAGLFNYSAGG